MAVHLYHLLYEPDQHLLGEHALRLHPLLDVVVQVGLALLHQNVAHDLRGVGPVGVAPCPLLRDAVPQIVYDVLVRLALYLLQQLHLVFEALDVVVLQVEDLHRLFAAGLSVQHLVDVVVAVAQEVRLLVTGQDVLVPLDEGHVLRDHVLFIRIALHIFGGNMIGFTYIGVYSRGGDSGSGTSRGRADPGTGSGRQYSADWWPSSGYGCLGTGWGTVCGRRD